MFSPTRLTWARTSVAKQSNCGSRLFERLRTWPNVTERDHAWRMWRCRYLLPQLIHEWLMLPWKGFEIPWRNICNLCCTTMFPGLLPSSWLLEFSSFNVFNYSFIFFIFFLYFCPWCVHLPAGLSTLYRLAGLSLQSCFQSCIGWPVRLFDCGLLPLFATICHYLLVFCSHSSRCVTTLFVPNACPSVSYCKVLDQFDKTRQDFKHLSESSL